MRKVLKLKSQREKKDKESEKFELLRISSTTKTGTQIKKRQRQRLVSKSNEQLMRQQIQNNKNPEENIENILGLNNEGLFHKSLEKIKLFRSHYEEEMGMQIYQELTDILDLLKGERVKAKILIEELKMEVQDSQNSTSSIAVNTNFILNQVLENPVHQLRHVQTQTQRDPKSIKSSISSDKFKSYTKIAHILFEANIDYRQILPIWNDFPENLKLPKMEDKAFKKLNKHQIEKLQFCFIKKIASQIKQKRKNNKE